MDGRADGRARRIPGALIVQDMDHEHAFGDENLRFLTALANQGAGVIYNAGLLEESRLHTIQLETAAQIARDVSGSLNLDDLLRKAVKFYTRTIQLLSRGHFPN